MMRQIHRAGEKLFIDYAGPTIGLTDGSRAHIFVAALGASGYTFACATPRTIADAILDRIMQRNRRFTLTGDSLRAERPKAIKKEKNTTPS
jgi:transposase